MRTYTRNLHFERSDIDSLTSSTRNYHSGEMVVKQIIKVGGKNWKEKWHDKEDTTSFLTAM